VSTPDDNAKGREEGERRKRAATARVERRHRVWVRRVQRAFVEHLMEYPTGTTDDIRHRIDAPTEAGTAFWGSAVLSLSKTKMIVRVGRHVSGRPERHGCEIGVWRLAVDHEQARHWLDTRPDLPTPENENDGEAAPCQAPVTPPPSTLSASQSLLF
jgi:hypothetical protein